MTDKKLMRLRANVIYPKPHSDRDELRIQVCGNGLREMSPRLYFASANTGLFQPLQRVSHKGHGASYFCCFWRSLAKLRGNGKRHWNL